jgi:hypothetical protein
MSLGRRNWFSRLSLRDRIAGGAAGLAAVAAIAAGIALLPALLDRRPMDGVSLCPEAGPSGQTLIIIDSTDELLANERRAVAGAVSRLVGAAPVGELISVHFVDARLQGGLSDPVFQKCKPKDRKTANLIYENPKFVQRSYDDEFEKPLRSAVGANIEGGEAANASPILEALFDASRQTGFELGAGERRLVLFSDLLQKSPLLSHYSGAVAFSAFAARDRTGVSRPDLSGVDVTIYKIVRDNENGGLRQTAVHDKFWRDYLAASQARSVTINAIR